MKMIYILKKGFQFFPPCLAQVLYLKELGAELEIYNENPYMTDLSKNHSASQSSNLLRETSGSNYG